MRSRFIVLPVFFCCIVLGCLLAYSCDDGGANPGGDKPADYRFSHIPASEQRSGNAQAGYDYMVNGTYLSSGIPLEVYRAVFDPVYSNELGRSGINAELPPMFSAVPASNGVTVVSQNCLVCHAQTLNGQLVVGLGNSVRDFTADAAAILPAIEGLIVQIHGADSPEMDAFRNFQRAVSVSGPQLQTAVRGMNPADKLTWILAAHRDAATMEWRETPDPALPPASSIIPTDVPAWWLLKKKHAMFYAGIGRGDFSRMLMAASILTMQDTSEAVEIDRHFGDVLAYIQQLEPPAFPRDIDAALAEEGRAVFERTCSACHGTYGDTPSYPNLLVAHETIGTDRALADSYSGMFAAHVQKFNDSWFGKPPGSARIVPGDGYVAPPLDGVWATAPYLHNASVPTIEDLLNSSQRPRFWQRSYNTSDYNYDKLGWNYTVKSAGGSSDIYDSSLPGHDNGGHTFGDALSATERTAVIEYLKSL